MRGGLYVVIALGCVFALLGGCHGDSTQRLEEIRARRKELNEARRGRVNNFRGSSSLNFAPVAEVEEEKEAVDLRGLSIMERLKYAREEFNVELGEAKAAMDPDGDTSAARGYDQPLLSKMQELRFERKLMKMLSKVLEVHDAKLKKDKEAEISAKALEDSPKKKLKKRVVEQQEKNDTAPIVDEVSKAVEIRNKIKDAAETAKNAPTAAAAASAAATGGETGEDSAKLLAMKLAAKAKLNSKLAGKASAPEAEPEEMPKEIPQRREKKSDAAQARKKALINEWRKKLGF